MTQPRKAVLEYEIRLTVHCPACGLPHYQGPALTQNFTEAISLGETRTCQHCRATFLVADEKLEARKP